MKLSNLDITIGVAAILIAFMFFAFTFAPSHSLRVDVPMLVVVDERPDDLMRLLDELGACEDAEMALISESFHLEELCEEVYQSYCWCDHEMTYYPSHAPLAPATSLDPVDPLSPALAAPDAPTSKAH